jgi:sialate O-acetylesterase
VLLVDVARAEVKVPPLFSDHMVLQRTRPVPIWGEAAPGEQVVVELGKHKQTTLADTNGKWMVRLKPLRAGGPFELIVTGRNTLTVKHVLVGEVWLCSGQSNMQFPVAQADGAQAALARADDSHLRLYQVERPRKHQLPRNPGGQWSPATSNSVAGFSAVGYYFGAQLRKTLGVPVGLIDCTVGGSTAQAWTPREALAADPVFKPMLDEDWSKWIAANDKFDATPGAAWPLVPFKWNQPCAIYDSMVKPLVPCAIRGVIWYQGEANAPRAHLYRKLFPALIRGWRKAWGEGDFPFLFVQLAHGLTPPGPQPAESACAELREAQTMTLSVRNTGMAVSADTAPHDIHPRNKHIVGERLALLAEAKVYGRAVPYAGPTYVSMKVERDKIRIRFTHARGLRARDTTPQGFAVAGKDRKWHWASAQIESETVVVRSDSVPAPVAVRYGWSDVPVLNLYNGDGLPAVPFRTDDWEGVTEKSSFVPADQL